MDDKQLNYRKNMEVVLLTRVAADPAFRTQLIAEPRKAIELVLGSPLPPTITVRVLQEKPSELLVVIPADMLQGELADSDLEAVAGGAWKEKKFEVSCERAVAGVRG